MAADAIESYWHVIVALILRRMGTSQLVITESEINDLLACGKLGIVCEEKSGGLHISIVDGEAADLLARANPGWAQS